MSAMLDESAILSAEDLGLSEREREALIQTRQLLAEEKIPHANEEKPGFKMNSAAERYDCGAACCIGGHMSLLMQGAQPVNGVFRVSDEQADDAYEYVDAREYGHKISPLFYPHDLLDPTTKEIFHWKYITPAMAVRAIDSFLTTGNPNWEKAISAA